jgi:hypothetical protein
MLHEFTHLQLSTMNATPRACMYGFKLSTASMMDSLQISLKGWPFSSSVCTVAIMVATYTPAVKGSSGISLSTRLARTALPTCREQQQQQQQQQTTGKMLMAFMCWERMLWGAGCMVNAIAALATHTVLDIHVTADTPHPFL